MTKIRININDLFCNIHCPACGHDDFSQPSFILKGWYRCKNCGVDIEYQHKGVGGLNLTAVVEPYRNRVYDNFKKWGSK